MKVAQSAASPIDYQNFKNISNSDINNYASQLKKTIEIGRKRANVAAGDVDKIRDTLRLFANNAKNHSGFILKEAEHKLSAPGEETPIETQARLDGNAILEKHQAPAEQKTHCHEAGDHILDDWTEIVSDRLDDGRSKSILKLAQQVSALANPCPQCASMCPECAIDVNDAPPAYDASDSPPPYDPDLPEGHATTLRSQEWFSAPGRPDMAAVYTERFLNDGKTLDELHRPIIGIVQSGSDLSPCNKIHQTLVHRVKEGIIAAGGTPIEFPVHPIFENCRRPTAAIDRNLVTMELIETLRGYPFDGVVLTTGCDKTTPSQIMAAATVNIPSIVLSGGPMLDGHNDGELTGSGTVIWQSRRKLAAGEIDEKEFFNRAANSAPSLGHCNTMGTASTMNAVAEALGMSLPGCAAIPAVYRERGQMAYETGQRIVGMVNEDLRPSDILKRDAFINAIRTVSALGGSTNAQPHIMAMAAHAQVDIQPQDWSTFGYHVPVVLNMQPVGKYLGERFHQAGGVPAVLNELADADLLNTDCMTVTGKTIGENIKGRHTTDHEMIHTVADPLMKDAGLQVMSGNIFNFAIMKTSMISDEFRKRYLSTPGQENQCTVRAIVFENPDDYHHRIDDPSLNIDENCILIIRNTGPVGYPGAPEVVNMRPPEYLLKRGIETLPTMGDGRQSGTSDSPSILHCSPESATGGGLSLLKTGDKIHIDVEKGTCNVLISDEEMEQRRHDAPPPPIPPSKTPWEEYFRSDVTQLETGAVMKSHVKYVDVGHDIPPHNH